MKSSASEITGTLRRLSARIWNPASARDHGHRLPASLARQHEEDWDPDQPQIRMSRAFAVMLVLHLVAVGGLFAFHVFGKDDQNAEQQATRQANASAVPPPARPVAANDSSHPAAPNPTGLAAAVAAGAAAPRAGEVSEDTPVDTGGNQYQVHVMLPGESKVLVAARYGITMKELEAANPGMEFRAGTHLTIPQANQRVITPTPGTGPRTGAPPVAVLAATNGQAPGARGFAMKTGQENPYQRDDHAVEEDSVPRSSPASAKPLERTASKTQEKAREKSVPRAGRVNEDGDHPPKTKQTKEKSDTSKPKSSTQSGGGSRTHVVQKGDTVYNVSRRYGLSPSEVMRANNISDPGKLQLGQVLKITVRH